VSERGGLNVKEFIRKSENRGFVKHRREYVGRCNFNLLKHTTHVYV